MIFVAFAWKLHKEGVKVSQAHCRSDKTNFPTFISWSAKIFLEMKFSNQFSIILFQTFAQFFQAFQPKKCWYNARTHHLMIFPFQSHSASWGWRRRTFSHGWWWSPVFTNHSHLWLSYSPLSVWHIFSAWSASHIMLMFPRLSPSPAADCWQETHFG